MKKLFYFFAFALTCVLFLGCGVYSFTGGSTGNAKTIQIDFFPNQAPLVEPQLSQTFTQGLQDLFLRQTNLELVPSGGDLHFEGEITDYRITPMSATATQTAAQNRLTITVMVRYFNKEKEDDNFEQSFSFFQNFDANAQLDGSLRDNLWNTIFERIYQDIFSASVGKW